MNNMIRKIEYNNNLLNIILSYVANYREMLNKKYICQLCETNLLKNILQMQITPITPITPITAIYDDIYWLCLYEQQYERLLEYYGHKIFCAKCFKQIHRGNMEYVRSIIIQKLHIQRYADMLCVYQHPISILTTKNNKYIMKIVVNIYNKFIIVIFIILVMCVLCMVLLYFNKLIKLWPNVVKLFVFDVFTRIEFLCWLSFGLWVIILRAHLHYITHTFSKKIFLCGLFRRAFMTFFFFSGTLYMHILLHYNLHNKFTNILGI